MVQTDERRLTVHVRLKPIEHSDQPHTANYTTVGVAQHIAYLDFGFLEPSLLASLATQNHADPQALPKTLDGTLVTRVAMGVNVLAQLHQQIQQILLTLRAGAPPDPKSP